MFELFALRRTVVHHRHQGETRDGGQHGKRFSVVLEHAKLQRVGGMCVVVRSVHLFVRASREASASSPVTRRPGK